MDQTDGSAQPSGKLLRVLALDGGGAKGFYTLGVLEEIEALAGCRLHEKFDLIYGTSTGAIIAALLGLGQTVSEIRDLYRDYVPQIMSKRNRSGRSAALQKLALEVFKEATFSDMKTAIGLVSARWVDETPMIFKSHKDMAHGRPETFSPGFGVLVRDAVRASCSAYPFFDRTTVMTAQKDKVELIDGGYCANNPSLYALADAITMAERAAIRLVSVGVGVYPARRRVAVWLAKQIPFNTIELLQKTLEINTQSMDQLRKILFSEIQTVRISGTFNSPELATDLLENDLNKLNLLGQKGRTSYAEAESVLREFLT